MKTNCRIIELEAQWYEITGHLVEKECTFAQNDEMIE